MTRTRSAVAALLFGILSAGWIGGCGKPSSATAASPGAAEAPRVADVSHASTPAAVEEPFPLPVVELRGTADEMGAAHGRALAQPIKLLHDKYLTPYLGSAAQRFIALAAAKAFESRLLPEHRAEVEAMAGQIGMDVREAMLAQCFLDLSPMTACSTVTLPAAAAPDHVARFGRNLDFPSLGVADKYTTVFVCRPAGRYAFASVGWPGLVGVLSGMNEHGLCLANMEVTRSARLPDAMPYTMLYRTALEQCKTVDEAVALIRRTPRQTANNLMLMDATGARAVAEITPAEVVVRPGEDGAALISTNHQRGTEGNASGRCDRYDHLHDTSATEFGRVDRKAVEAMLDDVAQGNFTLQSMVFEPANRVIYLAAGKHASRGTYYRFDLGARLAHASSLVAASASPLNARGVQGQ